MACVLVIDDDESIRELFREVLEESGHRVVTAKDGDEGVDAFRAEQPDFVFIDIIMPGKEGMETIRDIRKLSKTVRVIAISGGGVSVPSRSLTDSQHRGPTSIGRTSYLSIAKKLGADGALSKPFSAQDILQALADHSNQP